MKRCRLLGSSWILVALLIGVLPRVVGAEETARFEHVARVVAFGDVHGAYPALVDLLRTTGLIDTELRWSGGATHADRKSTRLNSSH